MRSDDESATFAVDTADGGEQTRLAADDAACLDQLGVDPDRRLSADELDALFGQYREGAECLRAKGHVISDPPSEEVFAETYYTDPWLPWAEVPAESYGRAVAVCPMPPPILP